MAEKDIFRERRSIRSYKEDPVPREILLAILEAGSYAPSGGNHQDTHRIVITNKDVLRELRLLVMREFAAMEITDDMYRSLKHSILKSREGDYIYDYNAPVLVITAHKKGYGNAMADSVCIIENMLLKATELSIGSCYINQLHWLDDDAAIREKLESLGLKEDETITAAAIFGYAEKWPENEIPRTGNPVTFVE